MATDTIDKLLEHVQMVYASVEEEQYYLFDKELEEEVKEYEKWEAGFRHSPITPLGLKREDYILRDLTMEVDGESEEDEEEEEDDNEEVDDYYEDELIDNNMSQEPYPFINGSDD